MALTLDLFKLHFALFLLVVSVHCFPQPTKWTVEQKLTPLQPNMTEDFWFHATVINSTLVRASLKCSPSSEDSSAYLAVRWTIRSSPCSGLFSNIPSAQAYDLLLHPETLYTIEPFASYAESNSITKYMRVDCGPDIDLLHNIKKVPIHLLLRTGDTQELNQIFSNGVNKNVSIDSENSNVLGRTWVSGPFIVIFEIKLKGDKELSEKFRAKLTLDVEFKQPWGYLSAIDKPLLSFYAVMCGVYSFYALTWTVFCFAYWRDLLRLQYWICAVIALGLIEKAVFLAEFDHMNKHGVVLKGVELAAEFVSVVKRALARVLVIIVSLGFGIVKPRLGEVMRKVLLVGVLYILCAFLESATRIYKSRDERKDTEVFAYLSLSVVDGCICYWVTTSLLLTLQNLKLRRNVVKLTLYRHFFNILVLCVLAGIAYTIWAIVNFRTADCFKDWHEIWIDTAYWHLLFSLILFAIIVLWRPSQNNQRYAFSPLMDKPEECVSSSDDDDSTHGALVNRSGTDSHSEEPAHIRSIYKSSYSNSLAMKNKVQDADMDDNLKWVEEHIPTAGFDSAIDVAALDSDEEKASTLNAVSKML